MLPQHFQVHVNSHPLLLAHPVLFCPSLHTVLSVLDDVTDSGGLEVISAISILVFAGSLERINRFVITAFPEVHVTGM